ncbi:MAG: phage tail tape measure protein [Colwellia sp.]|nr:phage tail tape measure protein [Colwellia sp.]
MADKVKIEIGGDTSGAQATLKDLEAAYFKTFDKMAGKAEGTSKEITKAFQSSGIRTEKAIKESSAKAKADFEKIKKSGVASSNDIRRAHEKMTEKIKKNNRELKGSNKSVIDSFLSIKSKIATVAGVVAGAFGVKAVGEAIKFEDALLDLQKVLSESDGPAEQFTSQAKEMALAFGVSASEVLQSASDFKQAGFDVTEAFLLTGASLKLVVASELEAAAASDLLVRTLNGFKAPASEADRLINVLNATSEKYATNVEELGQGMSDISGIAKKAGFSFEETAGLLVPVISVFGSGSEAAQALKAGMLKLISTQKPVVDELSRLGIHQRELNEATGEYDGKLRSAKDILLDVSAAFKDMDENQKLLTTGILAGTEQAGRMSEVFDGMGLSVEVTNNALKNTDSINKEVETRLSATSVQVNRLLTAFNNMAQSIGTEALPAMKAAIDVLIPVIRFLGGFGIRTVLEIQKAWIDMSLAINNSIITIAKATDFFGITSNAADTIASNSEDLEKRLAEINERIVATSAEGIEKQKVKQAELIAAKAAEVAAAAAQDAASEARIQQMLLENQAMLNQADALSKVAQARMEAAQASQSFVGPLQEFDSRRATRFDSSSNIPGFSTGVRLPGYGGGDKILARLEAGERVIKKEAVRNLESLGGRAMNALQQGNVQGLVDSLPGYNQGGKVEVPSSGGSTTNVNLNLGEKSFPMTSKQSVADEFVKTIKSINVVRGRKKNPY